MENLEDNKSPELKTEMTAHEEFKKNMVESFGTEFDKSRTITVHRNKKGGYTLTQRKINFTNQQMETMSKLQGKLTAEELYDFMKQKYPEILIEDKEAEVSPNEVKEHFEKLSAEKQQEILEGLNDSINGADALVRDYEDVANDESVPQNERDKAKKDLEEQLTELEATKKVKENLSK